MILTYKIKHNRNFERELELAKKVAEYGLLNRYASCKDVKHLGLKSTITNQILRKYCRNKEIIRVSSVKLTVPRQSINIIDNKTIYIPCIKLYLDIHFNKSFEKINQIEIGKEFVYISVSYKEQEIYEPKCFIGIDRNTKKHSLVACNINTGKVFKLGKSCNHIHKKYKNIREKYKKNKQFRKLKSIKHRENNIIKNINHNITKKIILEALKVKGGLVLENIKQIRYNSIVRKKQVYFLNSWSYYQQEQMLIYKSKKYGVPIFYVEPQYTSQRCSFCGHIEKLNRKGNLFQCKKCGKVENADVNAGFNIAYLHQKSISRFCKDRDLQKGSIDTPKEAMLMKSSNFKI
jgi:putative transposase